MKHVYKMAGWLLCWIIVFSSSNGFSQCTIQVTISGTTFGDEFNWQLTDGTSAVLLSGGQYGAGFNQTLSTTGTVGPYTLSFMGDGGTWCDNVPNYNVLVGGIQDIQGSPGVICGGTVVNLPLNSTCGPATPPSPTQDPSPVTCVGGSTIDVLGTPAPNVTWYWQVTGTGTSTANPYSGPYAIFGNGTYYLRAFDTSTSTWSFNSSSIVISNFPTATAPPAAMAALNPACAPLGTTISVAAAPSGFEYYWQETVSGGTSSTLNASTPYNVTSTGTYYVAAYEIATQCWSNTVGTLVTVDNAIPVQPVVNESSFYYCLSEVTMPVEAELPPSGSCSLNATASGTDNTNVTASLTNFSCATGNITSATLNASIGGNCTAWYYYSIIVNGVTVATQQCNQTGFNLAPYLPLTSVAIVSFDNPADGIGDFVNMNLTVNLNYEAASSLSWYDAPVGGNLLGTGTSIETIGTSVMPVAANGVYNYYVQSNLGGCSSDAVELEVNVTSVNVTIDPVAVSCNNGMDGTFAINSVLCGSAPFTFSVDGGAFGSAPTDLSVGVHTVVVQDGLSNQSGEYSVEILDASAPSLALVDSYNNDQVVVSWIAGAFEAQWNVEWGLPGFIPGTGSEVGSDVALTNSFTINGLDGNTDYEVYISANCGGTTTPGDWIITSVTTLCDPYGIPFVETFEDDSETRACWLNVQEVGVGNWTFETGSSGGVVLSAFEGTKNARFVSQSGAANPITKLTSPILLAENQDSVAVIFAYAQEVWAGDQNITRVYSRGSSTMPWNQEVVYTQSINAWTIDTLFVPITTDSIELAFEGENNWGRANVLDYVQVYPCSVAPGIDGTSDVCRLDGTIDLNTVATPGAMYGEWYFPSNPGVLNGSILNISTLASGSYDFYYIIKTPCLEDTTMATVTIYQPSTAGDNGVLTTCMNQPINLLGGLGGTADLGGVWTGPTGNNIPNGYFTTGQLPGQFNYTYVTTNGVCPNDTSEVLVNVQPCDWLSIDELAFEGITVYPNPSTGVFYISNEENGQDFTFEVLDLNGKVLVNKNSVIGSAKTELDLTSVQDGVYMIRLTSETGQKMIRIVKN